MEISKIAVFLIAAILLFAGIFLIWHFFFSIYELKPIIKPGKKIVPGSEVVIGYIPVNVWGTEVPFREVEIEFDFVSEENLIDTLTVVKAKNRLTFSAGEEKGTIEIHAKSKYFLATNVIKIEIGEYNE